MVMFGENHFGGLKYCFRSQVKGDIIQAGVQPSGTAFPSMGRARLQVPVCASKTRDMTMVCQVCACNPSRWGLRREDC